MHGGGAQPAALGVRGRGQQLTAGPGARPAPGARRSPTGTSPRRATGVHTHPSSLDHGDVLEGPVVVERGNRRRASSDPAGPGRVGPARLPASQSAIGGTPAARRRRRGLAHGYAGWRGGARLRRPGPRTTSADRRAVPRSAAEDPAVDECDEGDGGVGRRPEEREQTRPRRPPRWRHRMSPIGSQRKLGRQAAAVAGAVDSMLASLDGMNVFRTSEPHKLEQVQFARRRTLTPSGGRRDRFGDMVQCSGPASVVFDPSLTEYNFGPATRCPRSGWTSRCGWPTSSVSWRPALVPRADGRRRPDRHRARPGS